MNDDPFTNAAIWSFLILMLVLNRIWMVIKLQLCSNGPRGWMPSADLREFKLFAARQSNPSRRIAYSALRYAWHICFLLLFLLPIALLAIGYFVSHVH
jgi:hypothetical protein